MPSCVETPRRKTSEDRFFEKVIFWPSGCWAWIGAMCGSRGTHYYGSFGVGPSKSTLAHRWAYEHFIGNIPEGKVCDHQCDNPWCVNPYHLKITTQKVNINRSGKSHSKKTHCINGHLLSGDNLYLYTRPDGYTQRRCKACVNENKRRYRLRRKGLK
jgi:hypothetical protein